MSGKPHGQRSLATAHEVAKRAGRDLGTKQQLTTSSRQGATGFRRNLRQGPARHRPLLNRERSATAVMHNPHATGRRRKPGSPAGAQKLTCSFVHGICLLGGKADVGHFPSRGKHNNTRKHRALWECSKVGAAAPSRARTEGRPAWRSGWQSTKAESLGASFLGALAPALK